MQIPAENRELSPFTGWNRDHWLYWTEKMVAGFMQYFDPETGLPDFPANPDETGLADAVVASGGRGEQFCRPMMMAALYMAATGKTKVDGYDHDIAEVFKRGMETIFVTGHEKVLPRQSVIGLTLAQIYAPDAFLNSLKPEVTEGVVKAQQVLMARKSNLTNFFFFFMSPAILFDRMGVDYDRERLDWMWDEIWRMYTGDGWFIDGWNGQWDGYNFWAFQFYMHLFLKFDERWREKYGERLREITRLHEQSVQFYFDANGAPVPKGRSLNYRLAHLSGIGAAQVSGLSYLNPGMARRISSGCFKYFMENGALTDRGLLEPGWHGRNACVGENYTDLGAPYWNSVGLTALLLPEDHPFWTAPEEAVPCDSPGVKRCAIPGARMTLAADGDRGAVRMHVGGETFRHRHVWQAGSKFFPHAIDTKIGYPLAGEGGPELSCMRSGLSPDGTNWSYRTWPRVTMVTETEIRHEWDAFTARQGHTGLVYTVTTIPDKGELHELWHESDAPAYLRLGGYGISVPHGGEPETDTDGSTLTVRSASAVSVMRFDSGPAGTMVMQRLLPRPGFTHCHLFGGTAAWPVWTSDAPVAPGERVTIFIDAEASA